MESLRNILFFQSPKGQQNNVKIIDGVPHRKDEETNHWVALSWLERSMRGIRSEPQQQAPRPAVNAEAQSGGIFSSIASLGVSAYEKAHKMLVWTPAYLNETYPPLRESYDKFTYDWSIEEQMMSIASIHKEAVRLLGGAKVIQDEDWIVGLESFEGEVKGVYDKVCENFESHMQRVLADLEHQLENCDDLDVLGEHQFQIALRKAQLEATAPAGAELLVRVSELQNSAMGLRKTIAQSIVSASKEIKKEELDDGPMVVSAYDDDEEQSIEEITSPPKPTETCSVVKKLANPEHTFRLMLETYNAQLAVMLLADSTPEQIMKNRSESGATLAAILNDNGLENRDDLWNMHSSFILGLN
ncbi:MAG: hypothetical protein Q8K75_05050 [Chlamydiales bacterium]|nr:hypothetical protein [Chlamydiales bacterium]